MICGTCNSFGIALKNCVAESAPLVIYDNGTESDVLLRSLQRALHRDEAGRRDIMSDKTICGECGEPITGEAPGLDVTQRKPCPKCGSTRRTYGVELRESISSSVRADAIVITTRFGFLRQRGLRSYQRESFVQQREPDTEILARADRQDQC
jgi:hypothetical protein